MLDISAKNKKSAQSIQHKLDHEPRKALLMTQIRAAISINLINIEELNRSILDENLMDTNGAELQAIKDKLSRRIEYQAQIKLKGVVELLKEHTSQVATDILTQLGYPWNDTQPYAYGSAPEDGHYHFHFQF